MQTTTEDHSKVLSILGLARKSGLLKVGSDAVFKYSKKSSLSDSRGGELYIASEDCSRSVRRKLTGRQEAGCEVRYLEGVDRDVLGGSVGVSAAQVLSLPLESGLAAKIIELLMPGVCR